MHYNIVFLNVDGKKIRKGQKQPALYVTSIQRRGDYHRFMEPCWIFSLPRYCLHLIWVCISFLQTYLLHSSLAGKPAGVRKEWECIMQQTLLCILHWTWHRYADCSVISQCVLHLYSVHPHRCHDQQGVTDIFFTSPKITKAIQTSVPTVQTICLCNQLNTLHRNLLPHVNLCHTTHTTSKFPHCKIFNHNLKVVTTH